jgi:DNA repair exonuclease SbcCD ATPase subunit
MPLGLWKSKWEIHREDMDRHRENLDRYREEANHRDREWREETRRYREERLKSDDRWLEVREECRDLRGKYERELEETRRSTQEILGRMETTEKNIEAVLANFSEQMIAMRREVHENTDAVGAQADGIMKLADRLEALERRWSEEDG